MTDPFERVKVPETFTLTTGSDEEAIIWERKEAFFKDVRESLDVSVMHHDTLFREDQLAHLANGSQPTDNWSYILMLEGRQPIAEVMDWRDDFNYHVVSFCVYSLSQANKKYIERVTNELKNINMTQKLL